MKISVTKLVFDLNTMDEVTLVREGEFTPVASMEEFLQRLGGDTAKVLEVANKGLVDVAKAELKTSDGQWLQLDEETGATSEFTGTQANKKAVNNLVLTLAKTLFGFVKEAGREAKREAKEKALNFIRSNEQIKAGLIATAASDED